MRNAILTCTVLLLVLALPAAAQHSDILTGRVTGDDGRALAGVRVEAISAETEITRSGLTDNNGRYLILFPDGGGRYLLRFSFIGMREAVHQLAREAEEELLVLDVRLSPQAVGLDPINVAARRPPPGDARAGEQSTTLSQDMLNRLPLADLDPATLALLAAGVIGTGADSITGLAGFSVGGMSELLNQVTLDGTVLGQGGVGVPEEGMRQTSVTTSTFDASRGGFAGGAVSMSSARGTNRGGGGFSYRFDSDALQSTAAATTNAFSSQQFGGTFGGPIISNRLFYNGAVQLARNTQHRFALSAGDPLAALRSGVAVDSIARFLDLLGTRHGMSTVAQVGPYNQVSDDVRLQGRMDWNMVQQPTRSQTLSVRVNASMNSQDSTRISQLDLLQRGGDTERNNMLAAATLTSRFRSNWTNTLNLSLSSGWSEALPFLEMPEGRVRVTSDFDDGTRQTSSLAFGGNRSMPSEGSTRDVQLSSDLSLLQPVRNQLHRFKLGGAIQYTRDVSRSTDNLFGTFTYASLQDFHDNRPERYERALADRESRTGALMTGLYVGDTWRVSNPLEVTLGLRWDRMAIDQVPQHNPRVEELFGMRTDVEPVATSWSPRLGFNYRLNQQGQPPRALSGGVGVFAGRAPTGIFSSAVRQTGLPDADQRLSCIGDAVPIADWQAYLADPFSVPATCADGSSGQLSTRAPNVTIIAADQAAPSSLRAELGYRSSLPLGMSGNFRYSYSRGLGLWGYRDLNIDEGSYFTLAGEGRPFYGDRSAIVERSGATSLAASRLHGEFGNVFEVVTDRQSEAHQATASLNGWLPWRMMFVANYTLSFARDQGSSGMGGMGMGGGIAGGMAGGGGMGGMGGMGFSIPTAGSPNDVEWAPSAMDRRHTLNLMLSYPVTPWLELSGMTRIASGAPYTPLVNRDINGDGLRNDRAFVWDPASPATDPAVAAAMNRLLDSAPSRVQECLQSQLGSIAARNSCRDSWTQSLDLRGSFRPNLPTLQRRLTVHADFRNVLTGLDQLMHGRDGMRGWGEGQRPDASLLEVRGFDPVQDRFVYEVNEGFGQTRRGPGAFRNAFSVTLSGRVAVGGNPLMSNRGFGQSPMGGFAGVDAMGGPGMAGGTVMMGGGGAMMGGGGMGMGGGGGGTMIIRGGADGPIVVGGEGGMGDIIRLFGDANPGADSVLATIFVNPLPQLLEAREALALTDDQAASIAMIRDTLAAQHARRRPAVEPAVRQISDAIGVGGRVNMQVMSGMRQQAQLDLMPNVQGARRETAEAVRSVQRILTEEQWQRLESGVRALEQADRPQVSFNAVGMLDRLLANPLPVLLELAPSLEVSDDQLRQLRDISARLDQTLNRRREEIGRRFDNVPQDQVIFTFQQVQPDIERGRNEVRAALREVERVLTRAQWNAVPDRIRDPYQPAAGGPGIRPPGGL